MRARTMRVTDYQPLIKTQDLGVADKDDILDGKRVSERRAFMMRALCCW